MYDTPLGKRALKDLNPRHLILETSVLPTELRTLNYIIIIITKKSNNLL